VLIFAIEVNAISLTSTISRTSIIIRIVVSLVSCKTGLVIRVRVAISASDKGYCKTRDFGIAGIVN
jgi:hypothetical protein